MRTRSLLAFTLLAGLSLSAGIQAQRGGGAPAGPPQSGRGAAADDLTGTWVSVVAEHWHLRMLVPPRGEFAMLPLNQNARKMAASWDPAKEPAGDEQCKGYGAAAIMRVPSRLDIRWAGDNQLRMDIDSGTQTRLFNFGAAAAAASQVPSWQGYSAASWVRGDLQVVTTRLRPGYLPQERRALQRSSARRGTLRPLHRAERRQLARRRQHRHRPGQPDRAVHHERRVQEDSRQAGVGSNPVSRQRSPLIHKSTGHGHRVTERKGILCVSATSLWPVDTNFLHWPLRATNYRPPIARKRVAPLQAKTTGPRCPGRRGTLLGRKRLQARP